MSRKEVEWEVEVHSPQSYPKIDGWDEDIVETAGFIPLEVRFKQMEQAGFRAQFFESEFSSQDVTDMYLNHPEYDITAEDDLEEAMEKVRLRQEYIAKVKEEVLRRKKAEEEASAADEVKQTKQKTSAEES